MRTRVRQLGVAVVLATVLLAGCIGSAPSGTDAPAESTPGSSDGTTTTTATPTATTTYTPVSAAEGCARWVSFWGLSSPELWEPDFVRVGYTVTGNASVHFVAIENGTVLGTRHESTEELDYGFTADGSAIKFDESLSGVHFVAVRAYADTNGNGVYDRGVDAPCRSDGEIVTSGVERIDFSQFEHGKEDGTPSKTKSG